MDGNEALAMIAVILLTPIFLVVFLVSLIVVAPILGPLWLMEKWRERHQYAEGTI